MRQSSQKVNIIYHNSDNKNGIINILDPPPDALRTRRYSQRKNSEIRNSNQQNQKIDNVDYVDDINDNHDNGEHPPGWYTPRQIDSEGNASRSDYSNYDESWNSYYHAMEQDRCKERNYLNIIKDKSRHEYYVNMI